MYFNILDMSLKNEILSCEKQLYFKILCVVYVFESVQILMCGRAFMCNSELLRNPVAVACSVLRVYVLCFC